MKITSLQLKDFRNYEELSLIPGEGVTIFFGGNAQGKTNILEAVAVAGTSRSHKGSRDRDMIRYGQNEAHIRLTLEKKDTGHRIDMHLKRNGPKGIAIDRQMVRRAGELFGIAPMVFFSPEDLGIVKDGPAVRRRFTDQELSQLDPLYLSDLADYKRCLAQRNILLREIDASPEREDELAVWDEQLLRYGRALIRRRGEFTEKLAETVREIHRNLTAGAEELSLSYEPNVTESGFAMALAENRARDIRYHETHAGPHRDDLGIMVDGRDMRLYGSQGQQRTCALSMKMAEIRMIRESSGEDPVLLLDDVLSELDRTRQEMLLRGMEGVQTLITCTGVDDFVTGYFRDAKLFRVTKGVLEEVRNA